MTQKKSFLFLLLALLALTCCSRRENAIALEEGIMKVQQVKKGEPLTFEFSLDQASAGKYKEVIIVVDSIVGNSTVLIKKESTGIDLRNETTLVGSKREIKVQFKNPSEDTKVIIEVDSTTNYNKFGISYHLDKVLLYHIENNVVVVQNLNKEISSKLISVPASPNNNILTSFYSMDCVISVSKDSQVIEPFSKDFTYVVAGPSSESYITYQIKVESISGKKDFSYEECLVYILNEEVNGDKSANTITSHEGVQMKRPLKADFPKVNIAFPIFSKEQNLMVHFDFSEDELVKLHTTICGAESPTETLTLRSREKIIVARSKLDELCRNEETDSIIFEMEKAETEKIQIVDFEIYPEEHIPFSISEGKHKTYFQSDKAPAYFVYENIGLNETGELHVNNIRGTSNMFGQIIKREDVQKRGVNPNIYTNTLKFDSINQALIIQPNETENCTSGCVLLFGVQSKDAFDLTGEIPEFSLYLKKKKATPEDSILSLELNKFIQGAVSPSEKQFYRINLRSAQKSSIRLEIFADYNTSIWIAKGEDVPEKEEDWKVFSTNDSKKEIFDYPVEGETKYIIAIENASDKASNYRFRAVSLINDIKITPLYADMSSVCKIESDGSYCDFAFRGRSEYAIGISYYYSNTLLYVPSVSDEKIEIFVKTTSLNEYSKITSKDELEKLMPNKTSSELTSQSSANWNSLSFENLYSSKVYLVRIYSSKSGIYELFTTKFHPKMRIIAADLTKPLLVLANETESEEKKVFSVMHPVASYNLPFDLVFEKIEGKSTIISGNDDIPLPSDGKFVVHYEGSGSKDVSTSFKLQTTSKVFSTFESAHGLSFDEKTVFVEHPKKMPLVKSIDLRRFDSKYNLTINVHFDELVEDCVNITLFSLSGQFSNGSTIEEKEPFINGTFNSFDGTGVLTLTGKEIDANVTAGKGNFLVAIYNETEMLFTTKLVSYHLVLVGGEKEIQLPKNTYFHDSLRSANQIYSGSRESPEDKMVRVEFIKKDPDLDFAILHTNKPDNPRANSTQFTSISNYTFSYYFKLLKGNKIPKFYVNVFNKKEKSKNFLLEDSKTSDAKNFTIRFRTTSKDDSYEELFQNITYVNKTKDKKMITLNNTVEDKDGKRKGLKVMYSFYFAKKAITEKDLFKSMENKEIEEVRLLKNPGQDFDYIKLNFSYPLNTSYVGVMSKVIDNDDRYFYFAKVIEETSYFWWIVGIIVLSLIIITLFLVFIVIPKCKRDKPILDEKTEEIMPKESENES